MNSKNPYKNDIYKKGMTLQNLNTITQNKTLTDVQNNINAIAFFEILSFIYLSLLPFWFVAIKK